MNVIIGQYRVVVALSEVEWRFRIEQANNYILQLSKELEIISTLTFSPRLHTGSLFDDEEIAHFIF